MRNLPRLLAALAVLAVAAVFTTPTFSQSSQSFSKNPQVQALYKRLQLTPTQQTKFEGLVMKYRKAEMQMMMQMRAQSGQSPAEQLKMRQQYILKSQTLGKQADAEVNALFTPKQRKLYAAFKLEQQKIMMERIQQLQRMHQGPPTPNHR